MALPVLVLFAALACILGSCLASGPPVLKAKRLANGNYYYEMHVRVARGGPDCYMRDVVLVNGHFQPTLELIVNSTVMINVFNELPKSFPQVSSGMSMHWHGLYMWKNASWYDGASYVTQCPITRGTNFTYTFQVDEAPGSYFWHDHTTANRANGLQGALIIRNGPRSKIKMPFEATAGEHVLFLSDWYHDEGNVMAMRINRPVMQDKIDNNTGYYQGIPSPNALLINGKGFHGDCPIDGAGVQGKAGYRVPVCRPQDYDFTAPVANASKIGCTHQTLVVAPGKNYWIRLINAATAAYLTVCFEGHTVTMLMADGLPTEEMDYDCIDINSGQRYDVMLTTKTSASYIGKNHWVSVHSQYASMSPSTYAVLQYTGAPLGAWPTSPPPQPGTVLPWTTADVMMVHTHEGILGYLDNWDYQTFFHQYSHVGGASYFAGVLYYDYGNQTIVLNMTSPVMTDSGLVRWAINNVAMPTNPPCSPLMRTLQQNPQWLARNTIDATNMKAVRAADVAAAKRTEVTSATRTSVYVDGKPAPKIPLVGMHVVEVAKGEIIDMVINNRPASEGNADYPARSTAFMVQHPMHMHGHKFWLMGMGEGVYDHAVHGPYLNKYNPMLRDTATLPVGGWIYIRFTADNPGVWPFHCHVVWHHFMGQQMYILESRDLWPPMPSNMPKCSEKCVYSFGRFSNDYINKTYGPVDKNPHQLP